MRHMFKTIVQHHTHYCSQLWIPQEGKNLEKIEKLLRDSIKMIPGMEGLNYWERLCKIKMNSEQRRLERYQVIYTWKIMEGLTQNCGVNWSEVTERNGRTWKIPPLKGRAFVQTLRTQSFQISGPRLFSSISKNKRYMKDCSLEDFKYKLNTFLSNVPYEPKSQSLTPGATNPQSGRQTNSLVYQAARTQGTWASTG